MKEKTPVAKRFWAKVDKNGSDGCWLWLGYIRNKARYGQISRGGRGSTMLYAHRLSYELHYGGIPKGMIVRHICDNTACVNPNHLILGTQKDNVRDMDAKGRRGKNGPKLGSKYAVPPGPVPGRHSSVLTDTQVQEIWKKYSAGGVTQKNLAQEYGVSRKTVLRVINKQIAYK